jgi:hypothetical protein
MKKNTKTGTFGAPKPLPGQVGYNVTESQVLEKNAREMEMRLQLLQERMRQQNAEQSQRPAGSTRWKGSKLEKGSVTQYGREMSEKVKQRLSGASNDLYLTARPQATLSGNFGSRSCADTTADIASVIPSAVLPSVGQWSVAEVCDWLGQLQLSQYAESFVANAIDGNALLELTLEDLDYLQVTALGHRKILFRQLEALRQEASLSGTSINTGIVREKELLRSQSASQLRPSSDDVSSKDKKHWSQLAPLSSAQPSHPAASSAVNLADQGDTDVLDEEQERLAFQQAVAEWRRQDQGQATAKVQMVREFAPQSQQPQVMVHAVAEASGDMWVNPFANVASNRGSSKGLGSKGEDLDEAFERAVSTLF